MSDAYEIAEWFSGHETEAEYIQAMERFNEAFQRAADKDRLDFGPAEWSVLRPGDERCPAVPKWCEKAVNRLGRRKLQFNLGEGEPLTADAPALLVCVRKVTKKHGQFVTRSFLLDLTAEDHAKLRAITKKQWLLFTGGEGPLTDGEADVFIERLGPETARQLILQATVH